MFSQTKTVTVDHQVGRVSATDGNSHLILITTTKTDTELQDNSGTHHERAIQVEATYLAGPHRREDLNKGCISTMEGWGSTTSRRVKITTKEVMVAEGLQGLGIGSLVMSKIVEWALEFDHAFQLDPIKVSSTDATPDNQDRRNRFYDNFGVSFGPPGNVGVIDGWSLPMTVGQLKPHKGWETKINLTSHLEGLWTLADAHQSLMRKAGHTADNIRNLKGDVAYLRSSRAKSRWFAGALLLLLVLTLSFTLHQ